MLISAAALGAVSANAVFDQPFVASVRNRVSPFVMKGHSTAGLQCDPSGIIAGALRNDGDGWYAIQDQDHTPINIAGVETNLFSITVRFAIKGRLVRTLLVGPDEALAIAGFATGAAVRLNDAAINIGRSGVFGGHRVSPATVTTKAYPWSNIWVYGLVDGQCPSDRAISSK